MKHKPHPVTGWRYRLAVASRVLAALLGGYAVAALISAALTVLLLQTGMATRPQAVVWTSLLSFALYAAAAIWVFATRSATRAWTVLCAVAAPCALLLWRWPLGAA
ncbi:iron transporter [Comamonas piscis]|uniref:Iron transporter n=1 Tax=Comamonas piscis TaxID=1562974 RepID=A0A7G5EM58_9BURK|nr:iron transporter [Comamonas piscis]QMV75083.1 iron transporter [Comamonas piscis]WSO33567.1 iron transporter [Comamonas piscis]